MTSFAAALAERGRRWGTIVTIEGVGSYAGQWKFCSQVPTYAAADTTYKAWLTTWPDGVSERLQDDGGVADAGDISFTILDYDDAMTGALRVDRTALTVLDEDLTAAETGVDVADASGITAGMVVYIGSEAMRVTGVAGATLTVTRGWLGTDAVAHTTGHPVLEASPYLARRRVRLYWVPLDGDSSTDERLIGTYALDGGPEIELTDGGCAYRMTARAMQAYLSRLVCTRPQRFRVAAVAGDPQALPVVDLERWGDTTRVPPQTSEDWPSADLWFRAGKELLRAEVVSRTYYLVQVQVTARGQLGSTSSAIAEGAEWTQVYVASRDGHGSFRYSPGPTPSTSRGSGTWYESDQWVDLALALLTSPADEADGLSLLNYAGSGSDAARSNWSALPTGVGAGIPVAQLDMEAWASLRQRTHDYRFGAFVIGDEPVSVAKLLTDHFLRPLGCDLTIADGLIRPVLRRLPVQGEATTSIGSDQILVDEVEPGTDTNPPTYAPRVRARLDLGRLVSLVIYETTDMDGRPRRVVVAPGDAGLYAAASYAAVDVRAYVVRVPSVRLDGGDYAWLEAVALQAIQRTNAPAWIVELETDASLLSTVPGDLVDVTHADLPDLTDGTRGWSAVPGLVLECRRKLDDRSGPVIAWTLLCYPGRLGGRIAPSALIASVASNTATVEANEYTEADAAGELPATDAAAFTTGDKVILATVDGARVGGGGTQTVVSVSGDDIELDGNFGGELIAGRVLVFADRADAASQQYTGYVYLADEATQTVGASTDAVWRYAEP